MWTILGMRMTSNIWMRKSLLTGKLKFRFKTLNIYFTGALVENQLLENSFDFVDVKDLF